MKAILVPLKDPANAKTRLSNLLTPEQRTELVLAMFHDVAAALVETRRADRIFIATSYEPVIRLAKGFGFDVYREQSQISESHSVDEASRWLKGQGFDLVLRLPADVPLVRSEDIDALLDTELSNPGTVIVPSRDGTGTNAIARTPPDLFPSHFGPNSLSLHRAEAERLEAQVVIRPSERIGLDIDDPADIQVFLRNGVHTRAAALLRNFNVTL
ncbi:MAG: 2-phospho-L-lactate guanylyltransferase [Blastocatellia bacterium]